MEAQDPTQNKKSLCFSCKYGLCVKQIQQGEIVHIEGMPKTQEPWETSDDDEEDEVKHALIRGNGQYSFCFYPVKVTKGGIPIQFEFIEECSRYQLEETSRKKDVDKS